MWRAPLAGRIGVRAGLFPCPRNRVVWAETSTRRSTLPARRPAPQRTLGSFIPAGIQRYNLPRPSSFRMIGQTISHYQITDKLGEGGMGVVYKATDTKLDRPVALKFLAPHLLRDDEGRKRFEREAKAAASLDHPNICTVHEIDEDQGRTFIVMAFLEGRPLSKKIAEGPLKLPEALSTAIQIAEGLEAAHEKGIVHRDIKPDNVMLMKGSRGLLKIMDFGLAQLAGSSKLTRGGSTLGTMSYMSPEQAEGADTDHRTDLWALGVVLYEMVAGQLPFKGDFDQAVVFSIMNEPPEPLTAVRTGVPKELERIVSKCLAKKADERYQHADELLVDLQALRRDLEPQASRVSDKPTPAKRTSPVIVGAVAAVVLVALGLGWWFGQAGESTTQAPQYSLRQITRDTGITVGPALSLDGKLLAYSSDRRSQGDLNIWVQQLAGGDPIRLTEHEADDKRPSFSPDGSQIVFESDRDGGGIYVVSALGGNPRRVAGEGWRPRFSPDGASISFSREETDTANQFYRRIYVVPAAGGPAQRVEVNLARAQAPLWSPDGRYLLFVGSTNPSGFGMIPTMDWRIAPVGGGEAVPLGARDLFSRNAVQPNQHKRRWTWFEPQQWMADENYVLFSASSSGGTSNLWRVQLSADGRRLVGEPQRLTSGTGERDPSATRDGRIAFVDAIRDWDIWKLPIDANTAEVLGEPERVVSGLSYDAFPSISIHAQSLIYTSNRAGNADIWLHDLATGTDTPITVGTTPEIRGEVSPDGSRVVFRRREDDQSILFVKDLATETEKRVFEGAFANLMGWVPDGRKVLYYTPSPDLVFRLVNVDTGEVSDVGLEHPEYRCVAFRYSPRGDWLAFSLIPGEASGETRIYVARIEGGQAVDHSQWIEITSGGDDRHPWWSPDGNTVYFLSNRDEFSCIWAQPLDPDTKKPKGPLKVVRHLHGRQRIRHTGAAYFGYAMTADALYFPAYESRGNIWLATPQTDR